MIRRAGLVLLLFIITAALAGCSASRAPVDEPKTNIQTVKLYYGDSGNEKIVFEERQVSFKEGQDRYKVVLEELVKGPVNKDYRNNIAPGTGVYGTIKQDSDLIVDLSGEFNTFAGSIAEIVGVGSVVNTLTQFEEIKRVKILVEGSELIGPSGEPRGFMGAFADNTGGQESREVTLYFGNKDATAVVSETRAISVPREISREEFITRIVEEMIDGPRNSSLVRTIPPEVKVLSVNIQGDTAMVDFSGEMHTRHWGGAAGEAMTVNSIVNTLTELEYITRVRMTVAGEPMAIEHMVLEKPVERNEGMIQN